MREINKTIYEVLKMDEPEEGVNVTQLLTDDLIKKQESGEAKAVRGASEVLDQKAEAIHSQGTKSNISINVSKATGNTTKTPKTPEIPGAAKKAAPASKKVVKKATATKKPAAAGAVKKKAKVAKKPTPKPEKSSSPMGLILLIILLGAGAAYYFLMMK